MRYLAIVVLLAISAQAVACNDGARYYRDRDGVLRDACRDQNGVDRCEHPHHRHPDRDQDK